MENLWAWDDINNDWLVGSKLVLSQEEIVEAFNRVEQMLGREWIEASRITSGAIARGSAPTLRVVSMGQRLSALEGVPDGVEKLIERIRRGDHSAEAELTAIYLLRYRRAPAIVDLYPKVDEREADLRIRKDKEPWTYVEVTQPDLSEAFSRVKTILERITALVMTVKEAFCS